MISIQFPLCELCVVADEVDALARFCKSCSELLVSVLILKLSLEVLSEDSSEDHVCPPCCFQCEGVALVTY